MIGETMRNPNRNPNLARLITDKFKDFPRDDPDKLVHKATVWQNRVLGTDHDHHLRIGCTDGVLTFTDKQGEVLPGPPPLPPLYVAPGVRVETDDQVATTHVPKRIFRRNA